MFVLLGFCVALFEPLLIVLLLLVERVEPRANFGDFSLPDAARGDEAEVLGGELLLLHCDLLAGDITVSNRVPGGEQGIVRALRLLFGCLGVRLGLHGGGLRPGKGNRRLLDE